MHVEQTLRLVTGMLLWGLSALFSIQLFLAFGDGTGPSTVVLVLLSLGLEATKILSIRLAHRGHRLLAGVLLVLSVNASVGTALRTMEHQENREQLQQGDLLRQDDKYKILQDKLSVHQREITLLVERLALLPPDFSTAAQRLQDSITQLRVDQDKIENRMEQLSQGNAPDIAGQTTGPIGIITSLATVIGLPVGMVQFTFALIIAIVLEWGALALLGTHAIRTDSGRTTEPSIIRQENTGPRILQPGELDDRHLKFLMAMVKDAPLPLLHGRDLTAQRLGIQYYDAKLRVRFLEKHGYIRAEKGRYRLLVVVP